MSLDFLGVGGGGGGGVGRCQSGRSGQGGGDVSPTTKKVLLGEPRLAQVITSHKALTGKTL